MAQACGKSNPSVATHRADGAITHVGGESDTLHPIAVAYGVDPQAIIERN